MSIWYWELENTNYFFYIVLFDGKNTYWNDEMKPSRGYSLAKMKRRFSYIGEL